MEEKKKVYIYTRVSTAIQVDGYSLEAQKNRMKMFAEFNNYEIVGEYEDAGKSGKSVEGRPEFTQMIEDIKTGKDNISFVLVFKLSRFGRNAADVLSTLQTMQDFGVNLICVEDGIDSSKDSGKLVISVLSAVAEIERENIRVQTMEGRMQKARDGKWNGGFAPYGYDLKDGKLVIAEDEAEAIRIIFDKFVNTSMGYIGVSKYLEKHGYKKKVRQNGKNEFFNPHLIKIILKNPVYMGKIAYGRRRTEKVHGTRNEYHLVNQSDYLMVDGIHEAIVSEDLWTMAQAKLEVTATKYSRPKDCANGKSHLLSSLIKCPQCGASLYHKFNRKKRPDGTFYKDYYYYACSHRLEVDGHRCNFSKQIKAETIESSVVETITRLIKKPQFASFMNKKIQARVDTTEIEKEIQTLEKELRKLLSLKKRIIEDKNSLDPDDKHYSRMKNDLDDSLYQTYDEIDEVESELITARNKKLNIVSDKMKLDNIYQVLIHFDDLYQLMNEDERRDLLAILISEIHIYDERQPNGQWLNEIVFNLPIIDKDRVTISCDNGNHVETVALLTKLNVNEHIYVDLEMSELDITSAEKKAWNN